MSAQDFPRAPGQATGPPSCFPPPQSQGNGVVMETPLLNPLFLCQQEIQQLDAHVQWKRRQLSQGLPHLIQNSLERSVPSLLGFLRGTVLQDTSDPQRSLFKAERWQCLEQHPKQKMIPHTWERPGMIKNSFQMPPACGPAVQESNPGPDASGSLAVQHKRLSSNMDSSSMQTNAAVGALMCPRKTIPLDGSGNSPSTSLQMKLAKESLHSNPSHQLILGEQQDLALVADKRRPGRHHSTNGSTSSQQPRPGSSAVHNEFPNVAQAAWCGLGLQGCEKLQPNKCTAFTIQEVPPADSLSSRQDTDWMIKPDEVSQNPLLSSRLSPQGISKSMGSQELEPQVSQDHVPRLTSIYSGNRDPGICTVCKQRILQRPPLVTPSGKVVSGQNKSLALQQANQIQVEQNNSSFPRHQERTSPVHQVHCWPSPVAVRPGASLEAEQLESQTHPFQVNTISKACSEASMGRQRTKAFFTEDGKRYLEFHLRELLLHQRWGIPKMVQQSKAKVAWSAEAMK